MSHTYFVEILEIWQANKLFKLVCHFKVFNELDRIGGFAGFDIESAFRFMILCFHRIILIALYFLRCNKRVSFISRQL